MNDPSRHVLVTGGRRGLGLHLVQHLLAQGCTVTSCATSEMASLDAERHQHVTGDVSDANDVARILNAVRDRRGRLDALINNAGVASMNALALTPARDIERLMQINVAGTMLMSQAALRLLRRAPHPRIVNFTSVAVPLRLAGEAAYAASKAAVEAFTRVAAREFGTFGITCNAIGPSPIKTDLLRNVPEATLDRLVESQPIRRWATPSDVAHVVDFFLSPSSDLVTGQVLYLGCVS